MSDSYDKQLSFKDKISYQFHYYMCFTCRRIKAQIDKLQAELPKLCDCPAIRESKLSDEAKARIKANLST